MSVESVTWQNNFQNILGLSLDPVHCCPIIHKIDEFIHQLFLYSTYFLGITMVCRKKFSASNFWRDCTEHGVTVRLQNICYNLATTNSVIIILGRTINISILVFPNSFLCPHAYTKCFPNVSRLCQTSKP